MDKIPCHRLGGVPENLATGRGNGGKPLKNVLGEEI